MGVSFKDISNPKEINIDFLQGKVLAVDAFNMLYQFLTTIVQRDGSYFTDSKGRPTSHLIGLFSRTTNFMKSGIKLIFVFDGVAPELKSKERERRAKVKEDAMTKFKSAVAREDVDSMKKYASRTKRLSTEMIEEAKELIRALGLPVVEAPSEGDAQAAYIVKKKDAFATVSQDFDTLMHGTSKLVRNLSIAGKRKKANKLSYEKINPELITLSNVLNENSMDIDQLIILGIILGTDYNIGGVKGIGIRNGLKLVKKHGKNFDALFDEIREKKEFDFDWKEVFQTIKNMPVTDDYVIEWKAVDEEKIKEILLDRNFSKERIESSLEKIKEYSSNKKQKALGDFF